MRCFYVFVHGQFTPLVHPVPSGLSLQGAFAGRYLLARDRADAVERAFASVRRGLSAWNSDIAEGLVELVFEAEEVCPSPWWNLFRRSNRGHIFYAES